MQLPEKKSEYGQALVEFALILLVLLMVIFVVIESARLFQANLTVQNAARAGGRYAITGEFDPSCLAATPACADPRVESIKAVALNALTGLRLDNTASFDEENFYLIEVFSLDETGNWIANNAGAPGDPLLVRVTYRVGIITPLVRSIAESVRVRGQVVYNNERFHQLNLASGTSPGSDEAPVLPPLPAYAPPHLQIAKSASASMVTVPDPLNYTVVITNSGSGSASGIVFTDTLPSHVQYVSGAPSGCTTPTTAGGTITCTLSDLMPGTSTSLVYTVNTVSGGSATNVAEVDSAELAPVSASTTTTVLDPAAADLEVSKTSSLANGEVALGEQFDYTITVTNNGLADATNVVVEDTLDTSLSFVSVTPGAGMTCPTSPPLGGSGLVQCEIASLPANNSTTVVIRVSANTPGYIYNTASASGTEDDTVPENNSDTIRILAAGQADLSIVKTVSPDRIGWGELMLYTLQVTNSGPDGATGVVVTEDMPDGVGLVSMSTTQGTCAEDPQTGIVCSLDTIPSGGTATIEIQTIPSTSGWSTNTATVDANEVDPVPSNNTDSVTTFIEPFADFAITKSGSDPAVYQGDLLIYTLTVEHLDGVAVQSVLVEDQLSRDVTLESANVVAGTGGTCTLGINSVECTLNAMQKGDTSTIEIAVRPTVPNINATPYGDLTNTAVVTSTHNNGVREDDFQELNPANNTAIVSTYIGPGEQTIQISPACGSADEDTSVVVTGLNWTVSGGETVQLSLVSADGVTEIYIFTAAVPLAQSWTTTVTVPNSLFEPWGQQPWGDYNIRAYRKGTEEALAPFTFPCPAPDLVIDSLTLVSPPAVAGEPVTYNAVIRNQGETDAGSFTSALYFDPVGATSTSTSIDAQYQVSSVQVASLAIGATISVDFVVSSGFPTHGDHTVWALADSDPAPIGSIDEMLDSNNTANKTELVLARPVAGDDSYATTEDTPLTEAAPGVVVNDSDADSTFAISTYDTTSNNGGTVNLNGDGSFTYTPAADFNGTDTFTYQICDPDNLCAVGTVTITVGSVNDAPVAVDDAYTTDEDTVLTPTAPGVLGNDTDADGDNLTVATVNGSGVDVGQTITLLSGALLTVNADGSFSYDPNGQFEYLKSGESVAESFTYTASDGTVSSNIATVTITITGVNDAPVAVDDAYSTDEDTPLSVAAAGVLANDSDVEGDPLAAVLVSGPANGTLTLNTEGSFTYTPNANFNGTDSFTYTASDGQATSNTATVTITVNPVNDAPVAADDTASVQEDASVSIPVLDNDTDIDGDTLTVASVTQPVTGTVTINADGTVTFTATGFDYLADAETATVTFTYIANDGTADSNSATVTVTVTGVNDPPQAVADSYSTTKNTELPVAAPGLLGNDSDAEGSLLSVASVNGSAANVGVQITTTAGGTLQVSADGSLTYTPKSGYTGEDSFTYQATDGALNSNVVTVTITVNP